MHDVTELLGRWSEGDDAALDDLMPTVYAELRKIANAYLRSERSDHTLEATALVHEAYIRLVDQSRVHWQNRAHFYGIAAQMMRRVLVDHARSAGAAKRLGFRYRLSFDEALGVADERDLDLVALDDALVRLAEIDPDKARVVELRFFGGLSNEEVGAAMKVSTRTVERHWRFARAWLFREIGPEGVDPGPGAAKL